MTIVFPERLGFSLDPDREIADCVNAALRDARRYARETGIQVLLDLEDDAEGAALVRRAVAAARESSAARSESVRVVFDADGARAAWADEADDDPAEDLYVLVFMDELMLGSEITRRVVADLGVHGPDVDARVAAGVSAFENRSGYDSSMVWLYSLWRSGNLG